MRRVRALLQMLGALAVLAALVGGIPWALLTFGEWPITGAPTMEQISDLPTTVVSDDALFAVVTVGLWLSWAVFVGSVVAEAAAQARGRTSNVNFGGPIQRLAGRLVGSVLVSFGSFSSMAGAMPMMASATPATPVEMNVGDVAAPGAVWSATVTGHSTLGQPGPTGGTQDTNQATRTITVERGDTSWSLAEEYLGDGLRWREIWELNQHRQQPGGDTWANPSAPVRPGWVLVIPVTGQGAGFEETPSTTPSPTTPVTPASTAPRVTPVVETPAEAPAPPAQTPPAQPETPAPPPPNGSGRGHDLVVARGDNFWDLAESELAAEWGRAPTDAEVAPYWQQMIELNRDRLAPPHDPDLIYPEQVFTVPSTPADPLAPPAPPPAPTPPPPPAAETPAPPPPADETPPTTTTPGQADETPTTTAPEQTDDTPPSTDQAGAPPTPTTPAETPPSTIETGPVLPPPDPTTPPTDPGGGETPPSSDVSTPPTTVADSRPEDRPGTPEPEPAASTRAEEDDGGFHFGLLHGGVALAGVLLMIERRRRAQLRRRTRGHVVAMPPPQMQHDERELRHGADVDGARLLDVSLRAAAAASGAAGLPPLRWVEATSNAVVLVLEAPSPPPRGFTAVDATTWVTAAPFEELATISARRDMPTPTLIPLGSSVDGTEVLVELEASAVLSVSGPIDKTLGLLRAIAVAASTAPWSEQSRVLLVGMEGELTEMPWVTSVPRLADALDEAEAHVARITTALRQLRCQTTAQARAAGVAIEASEPLVIVSAVRPGDASERQRLTALSGRPHVGAAVITPANGHPIGRQLTIGADGRLHIDGVDRQVEPHRLDNDDTSVVVALLDVATRHEEVPIEEVFAQMDVRRAPVLVGAGGHLEEEGSAATGPEAPSAVFGRGPIPKPGPSSEPVPRSFPEEHAPFAPPTGSPTTPPPPPPPPPSAPVDHAPPPPPPASSAPPAPDVLADAEAFARLERELTAEAPPADDADILAPFLTDISTGLDAPPAAPPPAPVPEPAVVPETVVPETVVPETVVPETVVPETVVPEPVVPEPAPAPEPEAVLGLDALMREVDVLVRVLGEVQAVRPPRHEHDGEAPLLPTRQKGLEAITYLALRESAVDREDLEINLFPDGANASKTVYNTVSSARALVGEQLFPRTELGRYELSERVVTDYGLFCDLVAQADETDDVETAASLLAEALGLVRGEPFTGVGRNYAWVGPHRGMIVAQVVDAAEELAEIRLATGDWRLAEWAARRGLRAFPSDERMYRLLMRAARAAGNVPGVQRVFRELCDVIADPDLGVEPEDTLHPETVQLLEQLTRATPGQQHRSA